MFKLLNSNTSYKINIFEKKNQFCYIVPIDYMQFFSVNNGMCCRVVLRVHKQNWNKVIEYFIMALYTIWLNGSWGPTRLEACTRSMGPRTGGLWSSLTSPYICTWKPKESLKTSSHFNCYAQWVWFLKQGEFYRPVKPA